MWILFCPKQQPPAPPPRPLSRPVAGRGGPGPASSPPPATPPTCRPHLHLHLLLHLTSASTPPPSWRCYLAWTCTVSWLSNLVYCVAGLGCYITRTGVVCSDQQPHSSPVIRPAHSSCPPPAAARPGYSVSPAHNSRHTIIANILSSRRVGISAGDCFINHLTYAFSPAPLLDYFQIKTPSARH